MPTYSATAVREGGWWIVTVPAVDGVTQTRELAEARAMARDLIAVTLDVDVALVDVELHVDERAR